MTNPKLALSEERAVMLPVLAVLGGVVLFILIALGIDTVLVRRVRLEAQLQLEIICKEGSKHLPMAPAALAAVSGRLDDLMNPAMGGNAGIRNSTLTGFRVILPSSSVSLPAGAPFLGGTVTMSATACSYPGVSCSVSRNMVDPVVSSNYTPGFWNK
mgnify:FL=1